MYLDIRTLIAVVGITHIVLLVVLLYQYLINKNYRGIGWWVLWSVAEVVGFTFMRLRELPSIHTFAIILQNTMIILGMVFLYIGIMRFFGKKEDKRTVVLIFGMFLAFFLYFIFVKNDIQIRGIIITATLMTVSFLSAHALFVHRPKSVSISANITAALFLAHGCFFAFRTAMGFKEGVNLGVLVPIQLNVAMYVYTMVSGVLWVFALIVMINQRSNSEMKEAKEEMEEIFNTSPDAAVISRVSDGLIIYVNEGFSSLSGFTRNEMVGKSTLDVNIWENPEDRQRMVSEISEKGFVDNFETRFQRKDGSRLCGLVSAKIINLQGLPHLISVTRDIAKLKQAEEVLQERDIQFKKLSAWVPGMIYQFTRRPDGTYCVPFTTEAIKDIFGCSPQDVHEDFSPIAKAILPEDFDKVVGSIEYSAGHLAVWKCEYRVKIPGRPIRWLSGNSTPEKSADGSITWYGFNTDITERKEAEERLNKSESKYRTIFENAVEGIFQTTPEGLFLSANPALAKMFWI